MKKSLFFLIFQILFFQNCFSQEKYDWNSVKKVELHSTTKIGKCEEVKSADLNSKTLLECKTDKIIASLKTLKKFKYDVLIEKKCYALRVYFGKKHTDFFLYVEQGVIFKIDHGTEYFAIQNRKEFKQMIEKIVKANGL